ncbi:MAG: TerB family tellurite resistance protein [Hydrogenophaga sp.]|uniref:TerB family tellurite resistance protein n=1 Tax=Hydrogenophaga sp. TaxID=1904254 RepID=UPI0027714482|nr:TerB family tellurite resistance protein [Hydrogenophaga sp.]MDP2416185.1 TerB family tellurite resistance protein [Hydrogenophaga sp.]MDZ4187784.1 TerB family tellurite resistance protein [Hydrogenophaga sp.]
MRTYPINSPQAAARLLAMALVADGNYSIVEIRTLDRLEAPRRLGLPADAIKAVIDDFCQDLLSAAHGEWSGSAQMDDATRQALMNEVQDPALRVQIMELCEAVVQADGHLAEGEVDMLDAMVKAWGIKPSASTL